MIVSVISRWFNEEFFAPFFLRHYSWADEIIILLERSTSDRSAEIISRFPNTYIEWVDHAGKINDRIFSDEMSDLAASLGSDWVIRADADELVFPHTGPLSDSRASLEHADGNVIMTTYHWVYQNTEDAPLDHTLPAVPQRRHGGDYSLWPGMGTTFTKPCIVRPSSRIRWTPGEQRYRPSASIILSNTQFDGVHWQMVDVEEAVRRLLSAEKRLSAENIKNNWGVRRFTEAEIRDACRAHEDDLQVI